MASPHPPVRRSCRWAKLPDGYGDRSHIGSRVRVERGRRESPDRARRGGRRSARRRARLISHIHDDHIGWNVGDGGAPTFPNARYVIHRADWDQMANATDEEDREIFTSALEPLERAGVVELSEAAFDG